LLINHSNKVRENLNSPEALIVFGIESNFGIAHIYYKEQILKSKLKNILFLHEDKDRHLGIRTTNALKEYMVKDLTYLLETQRVKFVSRNFTCLTLQPSIIKEQIVEELINFSVRIIENQRTETVVKKYSGKEGGKKDDTVMSLLLNGQTKKMFYINEKYKKYY